jgi:hypothetical protein
LLVLIGVLEFLFCKLELALLRRKLDRAIHAVIATSARGIFSKALSDYQLLVAERLRACALILEHLLVLLKRKDWQFQTGIAGLAGEFRASGQVPSAVTKIADARLCDDSAQKASERVQKAELFNSIIFDQIFMRARQSASHIFDTMILEADKEVLDASFDPGGQNKLQVHSLFDKKELLKDGKHWQYLHWMAEPLGFSQSADFKEFSIFTTPGGGALEQSEKYWSPGWQHAWSKQKYEMGCIRGSIEIWAEPPPEEKKDAAITASSDSDLQAQPAEEPGGKPNDMD